MRSRAWLAGWIAASKVGTIGIGALALNRATPCHRGQGMAAKSTDRFQSETTFTAWTLWPSGLRRWLKAPFRKGVGSHLAGVTLGVGAFLLFALPTPFRRPGAQNKKFSLSVHHPDVFGFLWSSARLDMETGFARCKARATKLFCPRCVRPPCKAATARRAGQQGRQRPGPREVGQRMRDHLYIIGCLV